ncbi:MAG: hypothetical protein KGJ91_05115 [Xanthomonadaceae bacterium]|nr:hypothetical protein [Xanthomonadaceae bacterium]
MKSVDVLSQVQCLSAEQALAFALQAYYAAGRGIVEDFKASGEPWLDETGQPWANRGSFLGALHHEFTERLNAHAVKLRLPVLDCASSLLGWEGPGVFSRPPVNDLHPSPTGLQDSPAAGDRSGAPA